MYADGGGLYLQISRSGTKSWIFRFAIGRPRTGDGPWLSPYDWPLRRQAARRRGQEAQAEGVKDPIEARKAERQAKRLDDARAMTFKQAAAAYIKANKAGWKNAKHAAQWEAAWMRRPGPSPRSG